MHRGPTFTLQNVISRGIRACCVGPDGAASTSHRDGGLRVDPRGGRTTGLTDPSALPDATWPPTWNGLEESRTPRLLRTPPSSSESALT